MTVTDSNLLVIYVVKDNTEYSKYGALEDLKNGQLAWLQPWWIVGTVVNVLEIYPTLGNFMF